MSHCTQLHFNFKAKDHVIEKIWYISTIEYYLAIKKDEFLSFAAKWINWEDTI
jgi:hypothetical protein